MSLIFNRITSSKDNLQQIQKVQEIYENSFPENERRDFAQLLEIVDKQDVELIVATDNEAVVGFYTIWDLGSFCFLEHFAVNENIRGKGYGKKIAAHIFSHNEKPTIFEVEPPVDEISKKRVLFYNNFGFTLYADFPYRQPSYDGVKPTIPMMLMAKNAGYSHEELAFFASVLKKHVYEAHY